MELTQFDVDNISTWLLNQPNLPHGLATIGILLTENSELVIKVLDDD